ILGFLLLVQLELPELVGVGVVGFGSVDTVFEFEFDFAAFDSASASAFVVVAVPADTVEHKTAVPTSTSALVEAWTSSILALHALILLFYRLMATTSI
ncbi:MAG: hypothetical protein NXY57DRAFT_1034249, partial [Lentinula lateritia]